MSARLWQFLKWEAPYILIIAVEVVVLSRNYLHPRAKPAAPKKPAPRLAMPPAGMRSLMARMELAKTKRPGYVFLTLWTASVLLGGGLLGLVLLGLCAYRALRGRPVIAQRPQVTPQWRIWDVAKVAALVPFYVLLASRGLQFLTRIGLAPHHRAIVHMLTSDICYRIMGVMLIFWVIGAERGQGLRELGLHGRNWLRNLGTGMAAYAAVLPILLGLMLVTSLLIPYLPSPPRVPRMISEPIARSGNPLILLFVIATVAAPVSEEIFFRGMMQPVLRARFGVWPAILVSAFLFGLVHVSLYRIPPIFALGVALGYVAERTQSLLPAIAIHAVHNALFVTLALCLHRLLSAPL